MARNLGLARVTGGSVPFGGNFKGTAFQNQVAVRKSVRETLSCSGFTESNLPSILTPNSSGQIGRDAAAHWDCAKRMRPDRP